MNHPNQGMGDPAAYEAFEEDGQWNVTSELEGESLGNFNTKQEAIDAIKESYENLPKDLEVNEALFCTAIDNLIRNGLKYNDSKTKWIKIYTENEYLYIEDNGRGMSQEEFELLSQPYTRKEGQKESGTGLGLNICMEILREHGFIITSHKLDNGTKLKIKI